MKYNFFICLAFISLFSSAQSLKTYTYAVKGLDSLKLDVYAPVNLEENEKLPVVIWMHGGSFSGGSRDDFGTVSFMNYLTSKGYIGISISYRLLRKGSKSGFGCDCTSEQKLFTFANAAQDFLDAASYVMTNAEHLHIDVNKIIAGGSSAGAESVLNAVYMRSYFFADQTAYNDLKFAGVLSLAGALVDVNYITSENAIPTIMFHGTKDPSIPFGVASHHSCSKERLGYLIMHGPESISNQLEKLQTSYYLHSVVGGKHEMASIPFNQLDRIVRFLNNTVINSELIQTKKTVFKR